MPRNNPNAEKWYRRHFSVPLWFLLVALPLGWLAMMSLLVRAPIIIAAVLSPVFVFWMTVLLVLMFQGALRRKDSPAVGGPTESIPQPSNPEPVTWSPGPAVGVPRRFGVGKLLLLVALFAVLFKVLQWLGSPPIVFIDAGIFFLGVGASQAILYHGKKPREASIFGGAVLAPVIGVGTLSVIEMMGEATPQVDVCCFLAGTAILGAPLGYIAGCLIASLFLIKEREAESLDVKADPLAPEPAPELRDTGTPESDPVG